jgi:phosphate transport system permease protein
VAVDEHRLLGAMLDSDGSLNLWRPDNGRLLKRRKLFVPGSCTASAFPVESGVAGLGFEDGSVRLGRFDFVTSIHDPKTRPELLEHLGVEPRAHLDETVYELTPDGQVRSVEIEARIDEPVEVSLPGPIRLLDVSETSSRRTICAMGGDGSLAFVRLERSEDLMTGEVVWDTTLTPIPKLFHPSQGVPSHLLLSGGADVLYLAWSDGRTLRCDVRDPARARVVEDFDLVEGDGELTALAFLIGKSTFVAGDSLGRLNAWFPIKPPDARAVDGIEMVLGHRLCEGGPAITALTSSARSRVVAVGDADGGVRLWHVTSAREIGSLASSDDRNRETVLALALAPREDGIVALGSASLRTWELDLRHPEAGLAGLFSRVWYEGYPGPEHVWQSSSGTDDFEPKLGLVPLIFGTLKATIYSMLFAVPLALLAAIFTSQFLSPSLRTPIKSSVEMMASLPSVVLGFLAAIVVAPFAQSVVPAILASFFTVPFALLLGARLWQLLPSGRSVLWAGWPRLSAMAVAAGLGVLLATIAGPAVERLLFEGDLRGWLDHRHGDALGGWVVLLLPLCAAAVVFLLSRTLDPRIRAASAWWNRGRCARFDLLRFLLGAVCTVALAFGVGWVLEGLWLDPRGGVMGTYVQRNALIVGFVMGFAVVPIIYTLAEDALSSVPAHLRLASLGAGATPWQTAVRIVVPTAASGLFSAVMVGFGRAVGETMIVLMATGNTPVLSWNMFDGFRTLSANIAVELPEAVRDSTHYRTLFLAALCLFGFTFVFNTLAEVVRQRFRKRAFQL